MARLTREIFLEQVNNKHNYLFDYSLITPKFWENEYKNTYTKLPIICKQHGVFLQNSINHKNGHGCEQCRIQKSKLTYPKLIKKLHSLKNNYNYSMVTEDYFNNEYLTRKTFKIPVICPKHGLFIQSFHEHIHRAGCPDCNASKGENKVKNSLEEYGICFKKEYRFLDTNIQNLRFDFYLEEYNLAIEFDGIQHYKAIEQFGGEEAFKVTQIRDKLKNKFCKENDINLLRIPYWELKNIEKIIKGALNGYRTIKT